VVTSVVGNVVTLNAQIGYNVVQGALVTRLTRDVVVEPVTPNTDYYGVWAGYYTTDYTRKLILKDVQFRYVGSSYGQAEGGVTIRGYFGTNTPGVTLTNTVPSYNQQPWIEGLTLTSSNSTRDWGGLWGYSARYAQFRCCTAVGIFNAGIGLYYDNGLAAYNCIVSGSNTWGIRSEGHVEYGELAYNYSSRNYYANRIAIYDANCGTHRIICDAITDGVSMPSSNIPLYRWSITGILYVAPIGDRSISNFIYSRISSASGYTNIKSDPPGTYARGFYHCQGDRGNCSQNMVTILEDDFEYDRVRQFAYGTERVWDNTESAWRVVVGVDFDDAWRGWYQTIYIPANTTVIVSCSVKLAPNFSGTYPYLGVIDLQSGITPNQLGNAGGNWSSCLSGGSTIANYTAQATNSYETVQITISPVSWQRMMNVGVANTLRDASEGWWMKPIQVVMNSSYATPALEVANLGPGMPFERMTVGNSVVQNIIRVGGTRLN